MVYITKEDAQEITKLLSRVKAGKAGEIVKRMNSPQKKLSYVYDRKEIKRLLREAFKVKRKVKITYYSFSSDEVTNRIIDVYQIHDDCVVAYCNLRGEERTFKIRSINKATLLDERYSIPKGWRPESIILNGN